jgi:hypothetical protein
LLREDQIAVVKSSMGRAISVRYRVHGDVMVYQTDLDLLANSHNK